MKQLFSFLVVLLVAACGKDKFQTKPQLKVKSVNTKDVLTNETLSVTLEFTDKEGDVSDTLFIVRQRLNVHGPLVKEPSPYKIPDFPKTSKGEIRVNFDYQTDLIFGIEPPLRIVGSNPSKNEPDTLRLKFVAKDQGGNYSDTATVDGIIVERL